MAPKITMTDSLISEYGVALAVDSSDIEIDLIQTRVEKCETAINQQNTAGALAALGISLAVPHNVIGEVLLTLRTNQTATDEEKEKVIQGSKLGDFIQNSANATIIIRSLVALSPALLQAFHRIL